MKIFSPGDSVRFKSEHGSILDGTVCDSSSEAILISTHFGTYSVSPDKIISGGTWKIKINQPDMKSNDSTYDIGWWDTYSDDDGDVF
jgi:hypothetical protein